MPLVPRFLSRCSAAAGLLFSTGAAAVPQYFLVGDLADPRCQFATIAQAISAAQANGPELDYIMVANSAGHTGQALVIRAQSVLIQGGYANCDLDADETQPYADLVGNNNDPVIRIEPLNAGNYDVRLSGLRIRGGGRDSANGGGVRLLTWTNAHVGLSLERTEISGNRAQDGGGVYAARDGSPAGNFRLTLNPGTRIHDNTAASNGAGLQLGGGNTFIAADDVHIDNNIAGGAGGGIATSSGTYIAVGNPDIDRWPARNDVSGARIENNRAGTIGGGISLFGNDTAIEAHELIVDGNRAGFAGGGIAVSGGAVLTLLRDASNAFGWYCPPSLDCTRISNNQVADGITTGTAGGAVAVYGASSAFLIQTLVRDNRAQDASAVLVDGPGFVHAEGTVFSGNRSYDPAGEISASMRSRYTAPSAPPRLRIAYSSFTDNQRRAADNSLKPAIARLAANTNLSIFSSLLFDGGATLDTPGVSDCVVMGPDALLPPGNNQRVSYATEAPAKIFLSAARRDWRPRFDSPLTDVCDTQSFTPGYRDRDLQPRCRDEAKPNRWGACDVGAWENDQLFADGSGN